MGNDNTVKWDGRRLQLRHARGWLRPHSRYCGGRMPAHRQTTPDDTLPLRRSVHHMSWHGTRTKRTLHELRKPDILTS